mgnify:CR=1 FL=1
MCRPPFLYTVVERSAFVDSAAVLCFVTGIGGRFIPCSSFLRGFRAATRRPKAFPKKPIDLDFLFFTQKISVSPEIFTFSPKNFGAFIFLPSEIFTIPSERVYSSSETLVSRPKKSFFIRKRNFFSHYPRFFNLFSFCRLFGFIYRHTIIATHKSVKKHKKYA